MKTKKNICFIIILLLPFTLFAQQKGFDVTIHLDGLKEGEKVILAHYINMDQFHHPAKTYDSCIVKGGQDIHLKGIVEEDPAGPMQFIIFFVDRLNQKKGVTILLFVANGQHIKIQGGDIGTMPYSFEREVKIEGSPTATAYLGLVPPIRKMMSFSDKINQKFGKIQDSIGYDRDLVGNLIETRKHAIQVFGDSLLHPKYAYLKPGIPWAANETEGDIDEHYSYEMDLYNSMDEQAKNSWYGKRFYKQAILAVGQPMPLFTLPDQDGKPIALKDVITKSKVTLVHFWGTTSVERERYQKDLFIEYKQFHDKGLNVIAIAADSVADDWKFMLHEINYPWVNVSDGHGQFKGGIVNDVYNEGGHSIPNTTNVLLDKDGKIIAWDVSGPVLRWYLEKYLGD